MSQGGGDDCGEDAAADVVDQDQVLPILLGPSFSISEREDASGPTGQSDDCEPDNQPTMRELETFRC